MLGSFIDFLELLPTIVRVPSRSRTIAIITTLFS